MSFVKEMPFGSLSAQGTALGPTLRLPFGSRDSSGFGHLLKRYVERSEGVAYRRIFSLINDITTEVFKYQ